MPALFEDETPVRLFGVPQLFKLQAGKRLPSKGFILIAALLLSSSESLTRQAAAALLWEDADRRKAHANLRQLVARIRQATPSGCCLVSATTDTLEAGETARASDLAAFLIASLSDDPSEVIAGLALFRGDLLEGVSEEGPELTYWLHAERSRLRDRFFQAAESALFDITRFGKAQDSSIATIANRMLALDPEREESYRAIMEAYGRCGNGTRAKRIYQSLKTTLSQAEKTEPSVDTARSARRIAAEYEDMPSDLPGPLSASRSARRHCPRVAFLRPEILVQERVDPILLALVEDTANSLSRFRSFAVLSTHSSFARKLPSAGQANAALDPEYVVRSLVVPGSRVITFTLLHHRSGEILWSAEYELDLEKLSEIFLVLSKQVALSLSEQIERHLLEAPTGRGDGNAYNQYLQGLQLLKDCELPLLRRARTEFRKAANRDSNFADARARTAQTLQLEWLMLGGNDPYLLLRARAEAEAAIHADPGASTGHWMSAVISLYQRDFPTMARKFAEAESLSPNSPDLLIQYADALSHIGETEAAWRRFQRAIWLNPDAPDKYWWAGAGIAFHRGDYVEAVNLCRKMERIDPAIRVFTASLALMGDDSGARMAANRLRDLYPGMTAAEIVKVSPDQDSDFTKLFLEGLQRAGIN